MSIPVELQEGSLKNLAICINTSVSLLQIMEKEPNISNTKLQKMLVQTLNNLTIAVCSIGQCQVQSMDTLSILMPSSSSIRN